MVRLVQIRASALTEYAQVVFGLFLTQLRRDFSSAFSHSSFHERQRRALLTGMILEGDFVVREVLEMFTDDVP